MNPHLSIYSHGSFFFRPTWGDTCPLEDCLLLLWSQRMACVPIATVTGMWCRSGVAGIIKGQLAARRARPSLMRHATGRESCGKLGYILSYKQY